MMAIRRRPITYSDEAERSNLNICDDLKVKKPFDLHDW